MQGRELSSTPGPSTTQPSPTSTVYQPDNDIDSYAQSGLAGKVPDEERVTAAKEGNGKVRPEDTSGITGEKDQDFVVKWDGPDDPGCPLNTPSWKKWQVFSPLLLLGITWWTHTDDTGP